MIPNKLTPDPKENIENITFSPEQAKLSKTGWNYIVPRAELNRLLMMVETSCIEIKWEVSNLESKVPLKEVILAPFNGENHLVELYKQYDSDRIFFKN